VNFGLRIVEMKKARLFIIATLSIIVIIAGVWLWEQQTIKRLASQACPGVDIEIVKAMWNNSAEELWMLLRRNDEELLPVVGAIISIDGYEIRKEKKLFENSTTEELIVRINQPGKKVAIKPMLYYKNHKIVCGVKAELIAERIRNKK